MSKSHVQERLASSSNCHVKTCANHDDDATRPQAHHNFAWKQIERNSHEQQGISRCSLDDRGGPESSGSPSISGYHSGGHPVSTGDFNPQTVGSDKDPVAKACRQEFRKKLTQTWGTFIRSGTGVQSQPGSEVSRCIAG